MDEKFKINSDPKESKSILINDVEYPKDLILKIMKIQSLPEEVVIEFLKTQGKFRTDLNGKKN